MAKTQRQLQQTVIDNGFLRSTGSENFIQVQAEEIGALLLERAEIFKDAWIDIVNKKKIIASGDIETNLKFYLVDKPNVIELNIEYVKYATYVDRGVKGKDSDKNAPDSPYQFKNYGMSEEGRRSLRKYLTSGKAKVRSKDVQKYGAVRTESKFKKISEADQRLNTLIYNIKKYGIKKRDFINPVVKKMLNGFEQELADTIGKTVVINIFE
jgi:hypothetical protein